MRLMIKDQSGSRFTVYVCCDKCKKLMKQYTYSEGSRINRSDYEKLKEDLKNKMLKADMQYCYHCGERNFKD